MNQQALIMNALQARLDEDGVISTVDYEYGNVGTIRTVNAATLATTAELAFSFDKRGCVFTATQYPDRQSIAYHRYGETRGDHQPSWVMSNPAEVIDAVVAYLTQKESK